MKRFDHIQNVLGMGITLGFTGFVRLIDITTISAQLACPFQWHHGLLRPGREMNSRSCSASAAQTYVRRQVLELKDTQSQLQIVGEANFLNALPN